MDGDVDVLAFTGYGTDEYMPADSVEEQAADAGMSGVASLSNTLQMGILGNTSPTRSLVGLWFLALASYWGLGYFFRKARS